MTVQVKCKVGPGQFSGELAVQGTSCDGTEFSLFISEEYVEYENEPLKGANVEGWLRVEILDQDATRFLVRLPGQTFENGWIIAVNRNIVREGIPRELALCV